MWDGSVWARKNLIYDPGALMHTDGALYLMFSLDLHAAQTCTLGCTNSLSLH